MKSLGPGGFSSLSSARPVEKQIIRIEIIKPALKRSAVKPLVIVGFSF
jgi:hypothetical protein